MRDWQTDFLKGEHLLAEGRTEEALAELKTALEKVSASNRGVVLDAMGRAEVHAGRYRNAKRHFEAAVQLWTTPGRERAAALSNAGWTYLALEEYGHAEEMFQQALAIVSDEPALWQNIGQARFRLRRRREAEECLRKALSLASPEQVPSIVSDLAVLFEAKRQYAKAAETLREAIGKTGPGCERGRMRANLGVVLWKLRQPSESAAQFRLALVEVESAVGPWHPYIANILVDYQEVLGKTGHKAEAASAAARAAAIRSSFARQVPDRRHAVDWRDLK